MRKAEYARLSSKHRRFINGQKYTTCCRAMKASSWRANVPSGLLLAANKRLNTAYVLKEALGQLSDYGREWARHLDMKMSRSG